jgi:hypothetical protein
MPFLVSAPWLALLLALAFAAAARRRGGRAGWVAAGAWALYAAYEECMYLRILCTGECNIRIDLLLLHPLLIVVSVVAMLALWRSSSRA